MQPKAALSRAIELLVERLQAEQASIGPGRPFGILTLFLMDPTMPGSSPRRGTQAVNEGRL